MARRYALVIGIQDYQMLAPLTKTREDARSLADFLRQTGEFQDVFGVRSDATRSELVAALKEFQERAKGQDGLVYFTGHGFGLVDELTDGAAGYLAAADTRVETAGNRVVAQQNGIALGSLGKLLEQGNFSSLVLLLDACHSGLLLDRGEIEQGLAVFNRQRDYFLITACRGFEQAAAIADQAHSLFTGAVLRGLGRENADEQGKVSADRLFDFVARSLRDSGQEPLRLGMGSGITLVQYGVNAPVSKPANPVNPYQGLRSFTKETRQFFFGRDREIEALVRQVQDCGFVPVIGASGSGKSSVVRAGLMPRLEELGWRVLEPMKPGANPIYELQRTFDPIFDRRTLIKIHECIELEGLRGIVSKLPEQKHLLVIDQFEELFTHAKSKQREFIEILMGLKTEDRLKIVITLRSDFLENWQDHNDLTLALQTETVWLSSLREQDLRKAIIQPAAVQGRKFTNALTEIMLRDVEQETNCLPLLQFVLQQLWELSTQTDGILTEELYFSLGRLNGALDRYATRVYEELSSEEKEWARRICLRLVHLREDTRDTKKQQRKDFLLNLSNQTSTQIESTISKLIDSRLLVAFEEDGIVYINLAHEALLESWQHLKQWREENREIQKLVQRIDDSYKEWRENNNHPNFLMMGGLFASVDSQWQILSIELAPDCKKFYQKSKEADTERKSSDQKFQQLKELIASFPKPSPNPGNNSDQLFQQLSELIAHLDNASSHKVNKTDNEKKDPTPISEKKDPTPFLALKELVARLNREQNKTQDLISSLGFALRSLNNLNQFLELIPLTVSRVTDADGAALVMFRNGQVKLEWLHCQDDQWSQEVRQAIETVTSQATSALAAMPADAELSVKANKAHSMLDHQMSRILGDEIHLFGTPILVKNIDRGHLYVFSRSPDYTWTERRNKLMHLVADQAAVAIENDELTKELRKQEGRDRELKIGAEIQLRLGGMQK